MAQQLLQLARVAYKSLCEKRYIFTDLGEDFEHLGTMKKTTSLNVCTGPGYPSKLVKWLRDDSVIVRFLAGMCRHHDYHFVPGVCLSSSIRISSVGPLCIRVP